MNRDELLRLDAQLCFPLYAAANAMTRAYRPLLEALALTYPQYLVMLVLWEREPLMIKDLGCRLHLDSGTLTPLLKRLESAGLVRRVRCREDERQVKVSLTEAGRALRDKALDIPETLRSTLKLSRTDVLTLRGELMRLLESLLDCSNVNKYRESG